METTGEEGRIQGTEGVVGGLQPLGYITTPRGYIQVETGTHTRIYWYIQKLDRLGPVDNRPFTDKLHHFVRRKKKIYIYMTCDT